MPVSRAISAVALVSPFAAGAVLFQATGAAPRGGSPMPPVPVPLANPIDEPKRVLGKILFFEEQLSSDNTVACATCHQHDTGGADPRLGVHPGLDGLFGTDDDAIGSPGLIAQDEQGDYLADPVFGLAPRVTPRAAGSVINAAFHAELFWDGRAPEVFTDPDTGQTLLTEHAALESQAVHPPLNDVEMSYHGRDWAQATAKLAHARPLALASNVPADAADAVLDARTYPELFRRAFGDAEITAARVGMALATYQRTLVSDQTPFDEFLTTNPDALTPAQMRGWDVFQISLCMLCHATPLLSDDSMRNIGVRPPDEDLGRQLVTGNPNDRGKFKTPGIRNTGLKRTWMHNGSMTSLEEVVDFYADPALRLSDNLDPVMDFVSIAPQNRADLVVFLEEALTDPRVANAVFPFDAPDLHARPDNPANPEILPGAGRPDALGRVPAVLAVTPPLIGADDFKIGLHNVAEGAVATLVASASPPVGGVVAPDTVIAEVVASSGAGVEPVATAHWPIPFAPGLDGVVRYAQWRVEDPGLAEPALSPAVRIVFFCGFGDCDTGCLADLDRSGSVDVFDLIAFLSAFAAGAPEADVAAPVGSVNVFDLLDFIDAYNRGCP